MKLLLFIALQTIFTAGTYGQPALTNCRYVGNPRVPTGSVAPGQFTVIDSNANSGNILTPGYVTQFHFYAAEKDETIHLQLFSRPQPVFFTLRRDISYRVTETGDTTVAVNPPQYVQNSDRFGFTSTSTKSGVISYGYSQSFYAFRGFINSPQEGQEYRMTEMAEWRMSLGVTLCDGAAPAATTTPAPTTTTARDSGVQLLSGEAYIGCYMDQQVRAMGPIVAASDAMTPQICANTCKSRGASFSGVQNGRACSCGSNYGRYGGPIDPSYCRATRCRDDASRPCGGPWLNAVYRL